MIEPENKPVSNYTGSQATFSMIFNQIKARWGEKEAKRYDPLRNCLTYRAWIDAGFRVRRGEKALKSITFIPVEDSETGKVVDCYRRTVNLFYYRQLEKIIS